MEQHLKVLSKDNLNDAVETMGLRELKVETMKASRPEDVIEILKKIGDTAEFNDFLQDLIFGEETGLVDSWHGFNAKEQMKRSGQFANWAAHLDDDRRSCWASEALIDAETRRTSLV